jgi:hypothetical protein
MITKEIAALTLTVKMHENGSSSNSRDAFNGNDLSEDQRNTQAKITKTEGTRGERSHPATSTVRMTSNTRLSNISVSADASSPPINTAESPTQFIQSANGFTNKIFLPGSIATEMGKTMESIGTSKRR